MICEAGGVDVDQNRTMKSSLLWICAGATFGLIARILLHFSLWIMGLQQPQVDQDFQYINSRPESNDRLEDSSDNSSHANKVRRLDELSCQLLVLKGSLWMVEHGPESMFIGAGYLWLLRAIYLRRKRTYSQNQPAANPSAQ